MSPLSVNPLKYLLRMIGKLTEECATCTKWTTEGKINSMREKETVKLKDITMGNQNECS